VNERIDIQLPGTARAPQSARQFLRAALRDWALDGFGYVTELLADELVSNSVRHVGGPIGLAAIRMPRAIRVEVRDESAVLPVVVRAGPDDPRGRGLQIVDGLAHRWGIEPDGAGKTVWFELDVPGRKTP